jgi:arylformamidase
LPVYPGDSPFTIAPSSCIAGGDLANVSTVTLSSHSGTHLDPPRHFSDNGIPVDEIPLERLIGKAQVVEILGVTMIGREQLSRLIVAGVERLLLKTDSSELWKRSEFKEDFTALSVDGARYLLESGVKLIGIDYLSVESVRGNGEVHRILLDNDVLILEGINLAEVTPGEYELICLPLRIKGGDGAPVRALLRDRSN